MKDNKITAVCIAGVMAVSLTGCMDSVKDLSDEKSDMVAEYSAGLLLRHSDSYSKRLVTKADQTGNNSQEDVQTTATPAPVVRRKARRQKAAHLFQAVQLIRRCLL